MSEAMYFYAGNTDIKNGERKSFDGIFQDKEGCNAVNIYSDIRDMKEKEFGTKVCLSALNKI